MKRIIVALFVAALIAILPTAVLCEPAMAVEQTQNITVYKTKSGTLVAEWTQVPDNNGYAFYVNDQRMLLEKDVNYCQVSEAALAVGENVLAVRVFDENGNEGEAKSVVYVNRIPYAAPDGLSYNEQTGVLSWGSVAADATYDVVINRVLVADNLAETEVDLSDFIVNVGIYEIKVMANANGYRLQSKFSNAYVYTLRRALVAPLNVSVTESDGKVYAGWTKVDGAEKYLVEVKKDGAVVAEMEVLGLTEEISSYVTDVAAYEVSVRASGAADSFFLESASTACPYVVNGSLEKPALSIAGNVVSWNAVPNAAVYSLAVDGTPVGGEITALSFDVSDYVTAVGTHKITVQAEENGLYVASPVAEIYAYTYQKLAAPILTLTGSELSWGAVLNAKDYCVSLDGALLDDHYAETTFDLNEYVAAAGSYTVSVRANAAGFYTESDEVSITYVLTVCLGKAESAFNGETLTLSWNVVVGANEYVVSVNGVQKAVVGACSYTFAESDFVVGENTISVYAKGYGSFLDGEAATLTYEKTATPTSAYRLTFVDGAERLLTTSYTAYIIDESDDSATALGSDVIAADGSLTVDLSAYVGRKLGFVENYTNEDETVFLYTLTTITDDHNLTVVCNQLYDKEYGKSDGYIERGLCISNDCLAILDSGYYVYNRRMGESCIVLTVK